MKAPVCESNKGGSTPLHYAVTTNRLETVKLLLDSGADVNATFRSGSTALHIAANRGFVPIARLLIQKGALVDARDAVYCTRATEARDKNVVWEFSDHAHFKTVNQIQLLDIPGDVTKGEILR